jgi:ABC-type branched-subunit amino acid transport system substrate-binding protein
LRLHSLIKRLEVEGKLKSMGRILNAIFILLVLSFAVSAGDIHAGKHPSRMVFFDARKLETNYAGPGREELAPTDIREVLIGYFGPNTPSHPEGGDMWCAASLAIEEANRAGGYKGLPFRLVAGWSDNPWGTGISKVLRMAYVDKVWAIIGGIDGSSTHLAEQVVAKARLTLLNPASTDKTVNLANVPWMFSSLPGDHLQAPILAHAIASHIGRKPFLLVSAVDHDSHLFTVELARFFGQHRLVPSYHFEFEPEKKDFTELVDKIVETKTHALVLIAGAEQSAHIISAVRERNFAGPVFGGPCMGRRGFLEEAGNVAEGVIFPSLYAPRKNSESFEKKFTSRFGYCPDYLAAHTYDTVNLLVAAIRKAGLNRAKIRDAVRELSPWAGVTGSVKWDTLGSNSRAVQLGAVRSGRVISVSGFHGHDEATHRFSQQ